MKGLFEAVLNLEVTNGTEKPIKAFEQENERYLTKHTLRDGNGHIVKDELESVWAVIIATSIFCILYQLEK